MKKQYIYNVLTAVAGGIFGIGLYFAVCHFDNKTISVAGINYLHLISFAFAGSIANTLVWTGAAVLFFRTFKGDMEKDFKDCALILSLPAVIIFAVPIFLKMYDKLVTAAPTMLGFVYVPLKGYTHVNMAGYTLLLMLGFMWLLSLFLFALKFIKGLYENDIYFTEKQKAVLLFKAALIFFISAGAYVTLVYPPTGDEPHYLLIAKSLGTDLDVNLENDYVTQKTYLEFYPAELEYKNIHNTAGKDGKGIYSMHSPGLPAIIAVFYKIGGRYGTQLVINFLAALLIALLYLFLNRFTDYWKGSATFAALAGVSLPFSAVSSLILTEIPAALMILYGIYFLYFYDKNKNSLLLFFCLAVLPWFHSKLFIFSVVLFIWYYAAVIKNAAFRVKKEAGNLGLLTIIAGLFVGFYYAIYGSFAPFALVSICVSSSFYFVFSAAHSAKAFFAILFDRDFGLFTYNILLITFVWGVMLVVKHKAYKKLLPLVAGLPYFSLFLVWNDWTGSMTPARQMVPLVGIFILYAGYFIKETHFEKTKLFKGLFIASVGISFILFWLPFLRYAATKDKIYTALGKVGAYFLWLLPSFRDKINPQHLIIGLYIVLIVVLFLKYSEKLVSKKDK